MSYGSKSMSIAVLLIFLVKIIGMIEVKRKG